MQKSKQLLYSTKIFGYSDDLLEIETQYGNNREIDCSNKIAKIKFDDGTLVGVKYGKIINDKHLAIWEIEVENRGNADHSRKICLDENSDEYSDIFEIDAKIVSIRKYDIK